MPSKQPKLQLSASSADAGKRLDRFLQEQLPTFSRSRMQDWIGNGRVLVDGMPQRSSYKLRGRESIEVAPAELPSLRAEPEDLPVRILYEDPDVIAVDKPAGMVVHAGAGRHSGTLVNALLHHLGTLSQLGGDQRPGIVHRLDRQTSGVLLVARHDAAHIRLAEQFAARQIEKAYLALVHGTFESASGKIEKPIARDPARRVRMSARIAGGRAAYTEYRVIKRFQRYTLLKVLIKTGRTHQIRVHLASIGHPVAGDRLYGAPAKAENGLPLDRFFLHAHRICFLQPTTGEPVVVESPLPEELETWLSGLP